MWKHTVEKSPTIESTWINPQTTIQYMQPTTPVFQFLWTSNTVRENTVWKNTVRENTVRENTVRENTVRENTVREKYSQRKIQSGKIQLELILPRPNATYLTQSFNSSVSNIGNIQIKQSPPKYLSTTDIWTLLQTNTEYICWLGRYVLGVGGRREEL